MKVEIDQSGKIEETHRDTILVFSNSQPYSVKINARTKRRIQEDFRRVGKPRVFVIALFTIAIYFLVKNHIKHIQELIIDLEYPGHEKSIHRILNKIFETNKIKKIPDINFGLITKRSPAHKLAIKVFRKKKTADKIISYETLVKEIFVNKNGRPMLKYPIANGNR